MASLSKGVGSFIKYLALILICVQAFSIRLFSVVKYESVIHEFDPYFNYRVTQFLTKEGFYNLWNWFDENTWYPLGRVVGGTVYPGLIFTAGLMYKFLHAINIPIHVQEVCVFTAPLFSAFCSLAAYGLVKEAKSEGAGLMAAALIATVPSFISRSIAGSFDNEGVAIFALVNCFYLFMRTVNTGSLFSAVLLLLGYGYMVLSWGGYSFIINLLPIYCLFCILTGRLNRRMYLAFSPLVIIGTLMSASIPVVGFNAVLMSEHFASFFVWILLHLVLFVQWIKHILPDKAYSRAKALVLSSGLLALAGLALLVATYVLQSPTLGWTGRSLTLLDPTYASKYVPIIASVSEHQPTAWPTYIMDLHALVLLVPAGIVVCFRTVTDGSVFLVIYTITAVYFSGIMIRLMLVLAPAVCCIAAVALSELIGLLTASLKSAHVGATKPAAAALQQQSSEAAAEAAGAEVAAAAPTPVKSEKKGEKSEKVRREKSEKRRDKAGGKAQGPLKRYAINPLVALAGLAGVLLLLGFYTVHCIWLSADGYSAPSIVMQTVRGDGSVYVFDDFREAYAWLRHNTRPDTVVASWWDYGYQTTAMANRTVVVDNNTWNTTHIATVGRAMSSPEYKAWKIYRSLDVEYVFVVFGGYVGYPSDDINKFLWMVRIGGGVYPEIKEPDYLSKEGEYRIDGGGSPTMLKSLMYKLSYLDFADASMQMTGQRGFDRVRGAVIGKLDVSLKYFEEVFTSQHWMMRIYRVRDVPLREPLRRRKGKRVVASSA